MSNELLFNPNFYLFICIVLGIMGALLIIFAFENIGYLLFLVMPFSISYMNYCYFKEVK